MTWEERWHPLREEWVVVAAHRQDRPWNGEMVMHAEEALPGYVDDCYLYPGCGRSLKVVPGRPEHFLLMAVRRSVI